VNAWLCAESHTQRFEILCVVDPLLSYCLCCTAPTAVQYLVSAKRKASHAENHLLPWAPAVAWPWAPALLRPPFPPILYSPSPIQCLTLHHHPSRSPRHSCQCYRGRIVHTGFCQQCTFWLWYHHLHPVFTLDCQRDQPPCCGARTVDGPSLHAHLLRIEMQHQLRCHLAILWFLWTIQVLRGVHIIYRALWEVHTIRICIIVSQGTMY
jgi:hypothetical protein